MDELLINYGISNGKKLINIVTGSYLIVFCAFFCISEGVASRFSILFFCAFVGIVLGAILVLSNTLWLTGPSLQISNDIVESNPPGKSGVKIDWARVSKINIGMNYVNFSVNGGQKQIKLDLSYITYDDLKAAKSKVIEACEYKNIPYHND